MTKVEWRLWSRLRLRQLDGHKFRRQAPIGPFTADFACFDARLVVEVDGPTHDEERTLHDAARDAWLESIGFKVLRFDADQVAERIDDVVDAVLLELQRTASPSLTLPDERGGDLDDASPSLTLPDER
jgi:very-short-patch-repair endonuclease